MVDVSLATTATPNCLEGLGRTLGHLVCGDKHRQVTAQQLDDVQPHHRHTLTSKIQSTRVFDPETSKPTCYTDGLDSKSGGKTWKISLLKSTLNTI